MYARAREGSAEVLENEAMLASKAATAEDAHARRLEVDTLKWAAAKRYPKQYSDRIQQDVNATVSLGDLVNAAIVRKPGG